MATITKENIGLLHEKLTVKLEKTDYLPAFEKALKDYSKKANIPGFRKGMVPPGLIKKMYGPSVFTDEVLRSVDRELVKYLETTNLDFFGQPLPLETDMLQLDMNNPDDYSFHFELGMKPDFKLPDLPKASITRYKVIVTDDMIDSEVTRLQNRYGNMKDLEIVDAEDNILTVVFTECDTEGNPVENGIKKDNSLLVKYFAESFRSQLMGKKTGNEFTLQLSSAFDDKEREWVISDLGLDKNDTTTAEKYFKVSITKIGLLEKRVLNEEFFEQLYPGADVKIISDFRNKIKEEIQVYWDDQARNQVHDQVYHFLVDDSDITFPENFLKKWIKTQNNSSEKEQPEKTDDQVEREFPVFLKQLKWTLITDKISTAADIKISADELRFFAKQQLMGYMGMTAGGPEQAWMNDYVEKMMKDRKYIEDAHNRIQTRKIFEWAETQVKPTEKEISVDDFTKIVQEHQHHHH
jgi:trigger factor